ncbi:helix-turn-helix domain-containing protein [Bradyrhizobium septentrionale]|uniref:Helix-turn-helix domain-containing protein n=1 Tax=Bradyrhizobium septentrionale TaxID=1404411 RepID=A0ABZ2P1Q0_9BRAD
MASGTTLKLKQQRSRDRREQILSAATKLFGERGIDGTSLTDIAAAAKVPLSSLYDYFEDKRRWCSMCPRAISRRCIRKPNRCW